MWARLLSSTNQPNFLRYKKFMQQLRNQNALKKSLKIESCVDVANSNSAPISLSSSTDGSGNGSLARANETIPQMETRGRQ
jgi:hypothetical protein